MVVSKGHENDLAWMSGSYSTDGLMLSRAIVREGLSKLTETTIEFAATKAQPKLEDLVGKTMNVHVMRNPDTEQQFSGLCISVEYLGFRNGYEMYVAEVRPWFWLLTRTSDLRVFQEKSTVEIIKQLFSEYGFSDYTDKLSDSYEAREYCLQYRESDYAFLCRLMEEEGIYFYFDSTTSPGSPEKLVLCDGVSGHSPVMGGAEIEFHARDDRDRRREEHISEWAKEEILTRGKVTLNDFDFLTPSADLKAASAIAKGKHSHKDHEVYDYQGHYRKNSGLGNKLTRVQMEAQAIRHKRWRGASSVATLGTGYTFTLKDHPVNENNKEYLVTDAEHHIKLAWDYGERESRTTKVATSGEMRHDVKARNMDYPKEMEHDVYAATFGAILKSDQFRAPLVTPWPEVQGLQTATVVGKSGEEIWTDEHGRIKIQFHWDREGESNETSSCFVRVMTPWSGKNWGMVAIPRMGQEVVIQFEDGNPDRPICTGMLYNAETMPPYTYPDDQTQLGIKTNSSKGGGGYNELMFDDKKDSELMRVQAQKDHQMLVKDRSTVTVGLDAPDPEVTSADEKSYVFTVQQHMTETVHQGDRTEVVETGDKSENIQTGNMTLDVDTGNLTETIAQGDHTETVSLGNLTVDVTAGKIAMSAGQEIKLTVGASEVKIDNSGVTIKGPMIKIEGTGMVEAKAPMTTVKGEAMLTLKGGLTMIN
ncbi:type VI secretion system Vgr family protein [Leisingera caerulea]|uniref:type VI secretion system Vgr family protein n=1 Tax=Leisingera caerulea TaxID=506591 RepID=UPI00040694F5|nr:type VI secretion system tip protein TssI/VgrG [Leisingera caerulea]